jgi:Protein of unknown function (DUF2892)
LSAEIITAGALRVAVVHMEDAMVTNVGTIDRALRIIIGLVLMAYALKLGLPDTGWNWVGWIGVVPLLTALIGNCPLYRLVGVSTCPLK